MRSEGNPLYCNSHALAEDLLKCHQPKVIFDIGAHRGGYLKFFYECCPNAQIHAFEPHPGLCEEIALVYGHRNIKINQMALSSDCGVIRGVRFFNVWTLATEAPGLDLVPPDNEHVDNNKFDVQCVTLDSYCYSQKVFPGFLKVDIDGYEAKFLRGAMRFLAEFHPPMMMELSYLMLHLGDSVEQWLKQLLDLGYRFSSMDGKVVFTRLRDVLDHYPYNTSFDVMLL